jgi:hypothetical protein|tara:strand:+ start:175 stop:918 length:744 start_codon:yes stop_codon:yes gene_type:complete
MGGFEVLQQVKDNMLKPIYEKRRHLGCEWCGTTFYGYYSKEKQSMFGSPCYIKFNDIEEGVPVFIPPCPNEDCGMENIGVYDAKSALHHYNKRKEQERKKAERKAKKDAMPVKISKKLTYPNKQAYEDRLDLLAKDPDQMTNYEMMCDYFLDKVFWKKFGKGCHTLQSRHFTIKKRLWNGTYSSNSGKTRMGNFTPYFEVTNNKTGKVREVGTDSVMFSVKLRQKYGTNRRNDPDRNFGLPNSRGYK